MTDAERQAEITRLEGLLEASQRMAGEGGYKQRIEAIELRLKELRGE